MADRTKYSDVRAIALSVGEMLELMCALYAYQRKCEDTDFPATARTTGDLIEKINAQADRWLREADEVNCEKIAS